jgi:hypothetical protein
MGENSMCSEFLFCLVTESINNHLKLKYKGTKKTALLLEQSLFFMAGFIYLSHEGNFSNLDKLLLLMLIRQIAFLIGQFHPVSGNHIIYFIIQKSWESFSNKESL